jgi:hypothetical protein
MRAGIFMAMLIGIALCATACRSTDSSTTMGQNHVVGDYVEGCECRSVCPCLWKEDATFDDCRAVMAWKVETGEYSGTPLGGVTFAAALTKSGKNVETVLGSLEGILYLPADATPAQRDAVRAMMSAQLGPAFAKLEERTAVVTFVTDGERRHVEIEGIAKLDTEPIYGATGAVASIDNPPSILGLPKNYLAIATTSRYDDGEQSWDFAGRNSFYGRFEIAHP